MTSWIHFKKMTNVLLALLLVLSGSFITNASKVEAVGETVKVWVTTGDQSKLLQRQADVSFGPDLGSHSTKITVNENTAYQTMDGFGAAMTGSSGYLMNQKMSSQQSNQLLNDLFTDSGIRMSMVRHTIGASDFSRSSYTYNDMPSGQTDPSLNHFSLAQDLNDVVPMLQKVIAKNSSIKVLGSPWSAPAWMKNNNHLNGGKLQAQYYDEYANYFVKYINAYEASGIPVYAITVQNEPLHEAGYPSMRMESIEQADFIKNHLGPAFSNNHISTKILAYDHNWDRPDYPLGILNDAQAKAYVAGSAFHCYAGDPSAQTTVYNSHPDKGVWFTECSGGAWSTDFGANLKWNVSNLIIKSTRNWGKSVLLWNLALDQNHGPINGGCTNCRGVVTIDQNAGSYQREVEYYVIGHASKFVDPGAVRIESNTYDGGIESVAFKNPDGKKVLIALNNGLASSTFKVKWGAQAFTYTLPAGAVATFTWAGNQSGEGGGGPAVELDAFSRIQAENFTSMSGIQTEATSDTNGGQNIGWIDNGDWTSYAGVNFGSGANSLDVRVASGNAGGVIEVYLDSMTGSPVGTCNVPGTGGWQTWTTVKCGISGASNTHNLYLVFVGGSGGLMNVNWIQFSNSGTGGNGGGSQEPVAIVSGKTYKIASKQTGKALDIANQSASNGANVQIWAYTGGSNQQWIIEDAGDGYYRVRSIYSQKVLDVQDWSTSNGGNIQQWEWANEDNKKWLIENAGNGFFKLTNKYSGKVLNVNGASISDGANVNQWDWSGADNQLWQIELLN
ncbi:carbohydrate-binding protein [Paenibacillus sp. PL2-23]|uniref:carbohydrate-binding protein n=1 Tax=Paenibacillus sp. PL2-23 TaxID=2100729 RepID=UPI0030F55C59